MKTMFASVDYWRRVGITADPVIVPTARQRDLEYRAKFPGLEVVSAGTGIGSIGDFRRDQVRSPENRFNGRNRPGYTTPDLESTIDRYYTTIPLAARFQVLGQIIRQLTDQVAQLSLFIEGDPTPVSNRILHFDGEVNAHEWDVRT
jgi:hypothetical protein